MSRRWNRTSLVLVLAGVLATAPALALERSLRGESGFASPAPRVWTMEVLERLWDRVIAVWERTGASLDPDGGRGPSNKDNEPAAEGQSGASLDPDG